MHCSNHPFTIFRVTEPVFPTLNKSMQKPLIGFVLSVLALALPSLAPAQPTQFDLTGPTIEVRVQHGGRTLPIAEVPSLAEGDRLWLHPVFGPNQSARYLMVTAFLRGATNPPPEDWFTRTETWTKPVEQNGIYVDVPVGAEQAIVFLAPETGGDFSTIKNAVRGRPGSFVRASQDLNEASLDRARLDTYLGAIKNVADPAELKDASAMLARSLSLKLDQQCFDKQSDQQAPCLLQNQDQLILDNGRSQTVTSALVNGPAGDLALQAGSTPQANYGFYNGYIAAAMDIARILDTMHTAQYQYIPALASEQDLAMHLKLNSPPSFHNPKSVLVIALPPVSTVAPPALHPADQKQVYCVAREPLVLPADGAPSAFATNYAHDLVLHLSADGSGGSDKAVDLPAKADAVRGGFVVPTGAVADAGLSGKITASLRGYWGFDPYVGPTFEMGGASTNAEWKLADADRNALVVGRDDEVHLISPAAACVDEINFKDAEGKEVKSDWKLSKPDEITAKLPMKDAKPGEITLEIKQAGATEPKTLKLASLSEAGKLESFTIHTGDATGTLKGSRLDEVASLTLPGPGGTQEQFTAGKLSRSGTSDELQMNAPDPIAAKPGTERAHVMLKDGRALEVSATVVEPRPTVTLLNKSIEPPAAPAITPDSHALGAIQLTDPNELPLTSKLTFAVKSPAAFSRGEGIEVATEDGLASTTFTIADNDLTLQDTRTALATLDPAKVLGNSAFGPLRMRAVLGDGTQFIYGDWQPLVTLVRLPVLKSFTCAANAPSCTLSGDNLFLLDSVSTDPTFAKSVQVPDGFSAGTLTVPQGGQQLYLKLRDDPRVINTVALPPGTAAKTAPPPAPAEKAASTSAALPATYP